MFEIMSFQSFFIGAFMIPFGYFGLFVSYQVTFPATLDMYEFCAPSLQAILKVRKFFNSMFVAASISHDTFWMSLLVPQRVAGVSLSYQPVGGIGICCRKQVRNA